MITKEEFVSIMNRLREINDLHDNIDKLIRNSYEYHKNDFVDSAGFMICCEDIIIDLLVDMFNDTAEDISYFMYEIDFGRDYEEGCITNNGENIDFSSAEKLYDYLVKNLEKEDEVAETKKDNDEMTMTFYIKPDLSLGWR